MTFNGLSVLKKYPNSELPKFVKLNQNNVLNLIFILLNIWNGIKNT